MKTTIIALATSLVALAATGCDLSADDATKGIIGPMFQKGGARGIVAPDMVQKGGARGIVAPMYSGK